VRSWLPDAITFADKAVLQDAYVRLGLKDPKFQPLMPD
jgi:hypothetical protein